ncbi:MAG: glycosyltransferase family protein [Planctomycetaceae bacterium]|nr:glycosyltransferase family protein [Planctomycetaceae bacterium]
MSDSERETQLSQATLAHQQGNFSTAERIYRELISQKTDPNIGYLLGTLLLQKGDYKGSIDFLAPLAEKQYNSADLHNNLGVAYQSVGRRQEAVKSFQNALKCDQNYPQGWQNLGKILADLQHYSHSEQCYREVCRLLPEDLAARQDWIQSLISAGMWSEAVEQIPMILEESSLRPEELRSLRGHLAYAYSQLGDYAAAIPLNEQELDQEPDQTAILANLCFLYEHVGRIEDAIAAGEKARDLAPQSAEVANNLGVAYRSAHRFEDALSTFTLAEQLNPQLPLPAFNRGSLLLSLERFADGWPGYERRLELTPQPEAWQKRTWWDGKPIPGKTLLIVCDQGFGDILMYARFLPRVRELSQARTILQIPQELTRLFQHARVGGLPLADQFVSEQESLPQADFLTPLMSAGQLLQLTPDQVTPSEPYLQVPSFSQRAGDKPVATRARKIGLCWRGNAAQAQDHVRTLSLKKLCSLSDVPNVEWVSMQFDATEEELQAWPGGLPVPEKKVMDFADTANQLAGLDLLITVDTAIAHLAGALQTPVWTLLPHTPDWRWHWEESSVRWYPGMRLFRQPAWGDWDQVLVEVQQALQSS